MSPGRAEGPAHGVLVVIPSRWGSSRFPGKPLAAVLGRAVVSRVRAVAAAAVGEGSVVVATDDDRIEAHVRGEGGRVVRTGSHCRNGSERAAEAAEALGHRGPVVNLQGDAVLTPPWVVAAVAERLGRSAGAAGTEEAGVVTPAVVLGDEAVRALVRAKAGGAVGGTTVVVGPGGRALYFSKSVIPFRRPDAAPAPVRRHVGLYGYGPGVLARLVALPPGPLEVSEGLEQLRALEHGIPVTVVDVDYRGRSHVSIDAPEDVLAAEEAVRREGELLG